MQIRNPKTCALVSLFLYVHIFVKGQLFWDKLYVYVCLETFAQLISTSQNPSLHLYFVCRFQVPLDVPEKACIFFQICCTFARSRLCWNTVRLYQILSAQVLSWLEFQINKGCLSTFSYFELRKVVGQTLKSTQYLGRWLSHYWPKS